VDLLMGSTSSGREEGTFDQGIGMVLARVLASPQFIYRIVNEPAQRTRPSTGLSLSMTSTRLTALVLPLEHGPDEELLEVAAKGRLKDPAVLEQQVRRMLQHPKAEALAANFAGQWLNLAGSRARHRCR
jgi:hypothetical protein